MIVKRIKIIGGGRVSFYRPFWFGEAASFGGNIGSRSVSPISLSSD